MHRFIHVIIIFTLILFAVGMMPPLPVIASGSTTPPQINLEFTPDTIYPSQLSHLSIKVANPDTTYGLTAVNWQDFLTTPGLVIADNPNVSTISCGSTASVSAPAGGTSIALSNATAPAAAWDYTKTPAKLNEGVCTVTVDVTGFVPGNHTNFIYKKDGNATLNGSAIDYQYDAQATLLVLPMETPSVTKKFTADTIVSGEHSVLEIDIVNNDSHVDLTKVSLNDSLPANMSVVDVPATPLQNCGTGILQGSTDGASWHDPAAANDTYLKLSDATILKTKTCVVQVNVTASIPASYTNSIKTGSLVTYQGVTNPLPAQANLAVQNFGIVKSFNPANFQLGGTSTLTIVLKNPDKTQSLTGVSMTDNLPSGLTVTGSAPSGCSGTFDTSNSGKIVMTGGSIPIATAGGPGTCTITATVTSSSANSFTNTLHCSNLSFTGGTPVCKDATANVIIYGTGLGIHAVKSFFQTDILPDGHSSLTIKVTAPADTGLSNFKIIDYLPDDLKIYDTTYSQTNCGSGTLLGSTDPQTPKPLSNWHALAVGDTSLQLTGGAIDAGVQCVIMVNVTSHNYGAHKNIIQSADISDTENRNIASDVSATLTVGDIIVNKGYNPASVGVNGISALTITLKNPYPDHVLTDVNFTDTLGGTLTDGVVIADNFASTGTDCTDTTPGSKKLTAAAGTQSIHLEGVTIAAGASCIITVNVKATSSTSPITRSVSYKNTIASQDVKGKVDGTIPTENQHEANATLTLSPPDIRINKKFDPILVVGGASSTLTVSLFNLSSEVITGITFTDNLPAHMLIADPADPNVGTCGGSIAAVAGGGSYTFSGGALAANGNCKLTIKAVMDVTGNLVNTIDAYALSSIQGATNTQPTSATLTNLSGVSVTKKFSPNPVSNKAGSYSTLTITIKKIGIGVGLTELSVEDDLPTGLIVADTSAPLPSTTCGSGMVTADAGTHSIKLTNGSMTILQATCVIVVSVTASGATSFQNCIPAGTVSDKEGYTNLQDGCETLDTLFDPPIGIKVFNDAGLPELEWKMVWINSGSASALNAQIKDSIPPGTSYISGSIVCNAKGSSSTTICSFDNGNNQVFWQGTIGPDKDATAESNAVNPVLITFRVNVPSSLEQVSNQATITTGSNEVTSSNKVEWNRSSNGGELPNTGFVPGTAVLLPPQPIEKTYSQMDDLWMDIPTLNARVPIVGVPKTNGSWDVSWLVGRVGWLNGTAYPGNVGNSVLTAHVYGADGLPGPFVQLKDLKYGDKINVHVWGRRYEYQVRETKTVAERDVAGVIKHEALPWLTLVTCKDYNEKTKMYDNRTVVKAVLVKVEPEPDPLTKK